MEEKNKKLKEEKEGEKKLKASAKSETIKSLEESLIELNERNLEAQ